MNTNYADVPLVSVLMTAYNREQYIAEAIESVLTSCWENFELIIVDDCSKDNTVAIAKKYQNSDHRIKLYVNEKNLGDYPNRNKAASLAKGKYLMFCDSDDCFFENTIFYCTNAMESNPTAKFGMYYAELAGEPFVLSSKEAVRNHFFVKPFLVMGPGGTILNRKFFNDIGTYPVKYGPANDTFFNLKAANAGAVLLLPKLFLHYRIHEGQEQNNLYAYMHHNYRYTCDALKELKLNLSLREKKYLGNKNKRRFVVNLFNHLVRTRSINELKDLWHKAGFRFKYLLHGIFH